MQQSHKQTEVFLPRAAQTHRQPLPFYTCNKRGWSQNCQIKPSHQVKSTSSSSAHTSPKYVRFIGASSHSALLAPTETNTEIVSFFRIRAHFMTESLFWKELLLLKTFTKPVRNTPASFHFKICSGLAEPAKPGPSHCVCSAASNHPLKRSETQQDFMLTKVST